MCSYMYDEDNVAQNIHFETTIILGSKNICQLHHRWKQRTSDTICGFLFTISSLWLDVGVHDTKAPSFAKSVLPSHKERPPC